MKPDWLFFDLDDTVLPQETSVLAALEDTCRLVADRCRFSTDQLMRFLCERADRLWQEVGYSDHVEQLGVAWWEGLWGRFDDGDDPELARLCEIAPDFRLRTWQTLLDRAQVIGPLDAHQLAEAFITYRLRRLIPYPETADVLNRLRSRYRLGMITNGAPDIQKAKLSRSGLDVYFGVVVISGEIGIGKPAPEMFRRALDAADVMPDEAVMVGNSLAHDIAGAQQVGMVGVWVNRHAQRPKTDVAPDAEVTDLLGLLDLFDGNDGPN